MRVLKKIPIHPTFYLLIIWFVLMGYTVEFINFITVLIVHEYGHYFIAKKQGYRLEKFYIAIYGACLNYKEKQFERNDEISFKFTFISLIPTFVYVIFYTLNVLLHLENGKTTYDYDLYGFLDGGIGFAFFVLPFMLIFAYGISFVLWKINKKA